MKIAINITGEYLGGITTTNVNLIKQLQKNSCSFLGIELNNSLTSRAPEFYSMFAPRTVLDHRIIQTYHLSLGAILKKAKNLRDVERYFKEPINAVRKILQEQKPDIMLLSGTYYIPWIISLAAAKEGIPIVLRYAGVLSRETAHWSPQARRIFLEMERSISKRASSLIFPSHLCKEVVEHEVLKKPLLNSYVIPNALSATFTEANFVSSVDRRIAAVGRYDGIKNIAAFIALHKLLLKRGWTHTASLVTNKVSIPYLPKTINLLPSMTPEGIKKFYTTEGLVICPSKFETFGNVPMEAACLGIPVLVSDQMGCADILQQAGLSNMVTSFDDLEHVADKVTQLCGQYILPKQRLAIKRLLDPSLVCEEIYAVLSNVIEESV